MATANIGTVRRADEDADYVRFKVERGNIASSEDGMREDAALPGTFEWWYFEAVSAEAAVVFMIHTKKPHLQDGSLDPMVSLKVRFLDGSGEKGAVATPPKGQFDAKADGCEVKAGASSCRFDAAAGVYRVEFHEVAMDGTPMDGWFELRPVVPPARIGTGHLLFERNGAEQYFGWLVPVPFGMGTIDCKIGDRVLKGDCKGYHDHDWGDQPMGVPIHHWYWGRSGVKAGNDSYILIAANMVAKAEYGSVSHVDIVLIKNGRYLACGSRGASFEQSAPQPDPDLHVPVADVTRYKFVDGPTTYVATFSRMQTVHKAPLGAAAYLRFGGTFSLEISDGVNSNVYSTPAATWELMWVGDTPEPKALELYTRMLAIP
jgi:hypothetical protein